MSDFELPPEAQRLSSRELTKRLQTDITADHEEALVWGAFALERASTATERIADPTLAGEILAKLALRAELADKPAELVDEYLIRSYEELSAEDEIIKRERVATAIMEIRIINIRGYRIGDLDDADKRTARDARHLARRIIRQQHQFGKPHDRYSTMLDRHSAVNEALFGSAVVGVYLALRGRHAARRADHEQDSDEKHQAFVRKQRLANLGALTLAISKPISWIPTIRAKQDTLKHKLTLG